MGPERPKRRKKMDKLKHVIDPRDLSMDELGELLRLAKDIIRDEKKYSNSCRGQILATLFYEPSTRTRLSFEAAMLRLGGSIIGFSEPGSSSVKKGESLSDTIRTVASYADIIAMRHPKEGSAMYASQYSTVPVINAGDGGHYHPTQTLTDLLTIEETQGRLDNLTIGLCGDLKFGRTVHSLIKTMCQFENIKFVLISPEELRIPSYLRNEVLRYKPFKEVASIDDSIEELDVLYMTRVQRERFFNEADYIRLKDSYVLTSDKLDKAKDSLSILHPLPRVNEISKEVDDDPRACYFDQVKYGMYVRMALILKLLEVA